MNAFGQDTKAWLRSCYWEKKNTNIKAKIKETMDSCQSVERELERLAKKYSNLREHTDSSLTELTYQIVTIQEDLLKGMTEVKFSSIAKVAHEHECLMH